MKEREGQPREILESRIKREKEFPQDPEKRFEALFAAIGNSEAKCLTLLCLSQNPLTGRDLRQKFLEESSRVWNVNYLTLATYCLRTLIPIGLVAEADILYYGATEYVTGFRLTKAGLKYGQPIAAFLLEQSAKLPNSLLKIFGPTSKGRGQTRSVINRVKILETLSRTKAPRRKRDISQDLQMRLISSHLKHLANLGLVEYVSVNTEQEGFAPYVLCEGVQRKQVKIIKKDPNLTNQVADLLFKHKTVDVVSLAEELRKQYKYLLWKQKKKDSLKIRISNILTGLSRQKICRPILFIGGKIQSQAKITTEGKRVVEEILFPIREALVGNDNLLFSWRNISWQRYTREAVLKHYEASNIAHRKPIEDWVGEALTIISRNPGIRPSQIHSILRRDPGDLIKILSESGMVKKERQGSATHYYSVNPSNPIQS